MLNQPKGTIAFQKQQEKEWYGNEDISSISTTKGNGVVEHDYICCNTDTNEVLYVKKKSKNYDGLIWFAFKDAFCTNEYISAYTFRNLKGMMV